MTERDDVVVLKCWHCRRSGCQMCHDTGVVFWSYGKSFPYSPAGEQRAIEWAKLNERE